MNTDESIGPFGRSFVGDFPTIGTVLLLASTFILSILFSLGNLIAFLVLFTIMSSSVAYISYNFIEPHFNSNNGINDDFSPINNDGNNILKSSGYGRPKHIMSFQDSIRICFKKWFTWNGRASRSEYNWFIIPLTIFTEIVIRIPVPSQSKILLAFYFLIFTLLLLLLLIVLIPATMVWIRRAHDIGFSGWYLLLGIFISIICSLLSSYLYYIFIIPFYLMFYILPGQKVMNKYGPVPTNNFEEGNTDSYPNEIWDFSGSNIFRVLQNETMNQDTDFKNFIFSRKGPIIGYWPDESKTKTWMKILSVYIGIFLFFKITTFIMVESFENFNISQIDLIWEIQSTLVYLISFLSLLFVLTIEDKFEYFRELLKLPTLQRPIIILFLCSFILIIDFIISGFVGILISSGLDDYFVDPNSDSNIIILLLYFINVVIAAPIVEELFFRGYLLDKMRVQHSDIFTILITGSLFGLIHWSPYDFWNLSPILFTGIGGVLYAWLRIKTGSVWPSIICHSIWNLFAGVIIFL